MDGPVVKAARQALARHDVGLVLPYVKLDAEAEIREAYERTMLVRNGNAAVNEIADRYFFETLVRVHRAGEGAPYTGLKPAGLPVGPVIPIAERACESGEAEELVRFLTASITAEVERRVEEVVQRRADAPESITAARAYVEAMLGLQVWAHQVYGWVTGEAHAGAEGEHHH